MGKENLLTTTKVTNAKAGVKLADGGGLHLVVRPSGEKLWQYRFKLGGKENTHSIGAYDDGAISLAKARELRNDARDLVREGKNPNAERKREREANVRAELLKKESSFRAAFEGWMKATASGLSPSTASQRRREIEQHAGQLLSMSILDITRPDIVQVLAPLEARVPETARDLRQHVTAIFEKAIDDGLLTANPCPTRRRIKRNPPRQHPALMGKPFKAFLVALSDDKTAELKCVVAMELLILTTGRKIEVTSARWSEFNLEDALWEVPEERMKERLPHCVPLPRQAVDLLIAWRAMSTGNSPFVFPNRRSSKRPMASGSLNALMVRLGFKGQGTPHGHRSTFSTHFNQRGANPDAIERCLAHVHGNKSRAAYNRYEYLEERRQLLQEWADHIDQLRLTDRLKPADMSP